VRSEKLKGFAYLLDKILILNPEPKPLNLEQLKEFADLLDKIFILDPAKRSSVQDCLKHPFIKDLPA